MPQADYGTTYLLNIHDKGIPFNKKAKNIIRDSAMDYMAYYKLPKSQCFTNRPNETENLTIVGSGSLAPLTINDRLLILAHADTTEVGPYGPKALAEKLQGWGLTAAKLITFKACEVGAGTYLDNFVAACSGKISVAWVKGYKGAASTDKGFGGHPRELVEIEGVDVKGHDPRRVRIVPGTVANVPLGHWYFSEAAG